MWCFHCNWSICCDYWFQIFTLSPLLLPIADIGSVCGRIRNFLGLVDGLFLDVAAVHHSAGSVLYLQSTMQRAAQWKGVNVIR